MKRYASIYKEELLENVIPFWLRHSKDNEGGGFFTCLDRKGNVFDKDKFVWLQAREVWMFSSLCYHLGTRKDWLGMAQHGADFLCSNGRAANGDFYFSLDQMGNPLMQPYNIFSDCFAAMAFGSLYKVDPQEKYAQLARATFQRILDRQSNPKGKYTKNFPGTRDLKGFALPMILSNLTLELEHLLDEEMVKELCENIIQEIQEVFYHKPSGLVLENVLANGEFSDSFDGRLTSPGHTLEAMWFLLDLSAKFQLKELADWAIKVGMHTLENGWDKEYGGVYYFLDVMGYPSEKLDWNQKLWWVHLETLVFLAKAYAVSKDEAVAKWFEKVHEYSWNHFRDEEYGEWYGYLDRYGKVLLPLKGGKWKGCFHVPRALFQCWQTFEGLDSA